MDEVRGDNLVLGVAQDALEVGLGGLLEGSLDLGEGGGLLGLEGEVDDGDGGGGDAEGHAGELALDLGDDEADGLGGAGGGGDDVLRGGAAALPVLLGGAVDGLLRGGVGVDGGHEALGEAEALLKEDVDDGGEAVGGARSVGDDVVGGGVVLVVVDAHDDGDVLVLGGGGDDDLLGAGGDVALGLLGLGVEAGALNDELDAEGGPRKVGGGLGGDDEDILAVDDDDVVLSLVGGALLGADLAVEAALGGIVLEEVGQVVGGDDIADGDDVELSAEEALLDESAEDEATDAAKAVDSNLESHFFGGVGDTLVN